MTHFKPGNNVLYLNSKTKLPSNKYTCTVIKIHNRDQIEVNFRATKYCSGYYEGYNFGNFSFPAECFCLVDEHLTTPIQRKIKKLWNKSNWVTSHPTTSMT
jgi:hypothetical protein